MVQQNSVFNQSAVVEPVLRLFVWDNMRETRHKHTQLMMRNCKKLGYGFVKGFQLYRAYANSAMVFEKPENKAMYGEMYAVSPAALYWVDEQQSSDMVRVQTYVTYGQPLKAGSKAEPKFATEAAWIYYSVNTKPLTATEIGTIYDITD